MKRENKLRFLSGNMLKFIACITMLIDHAGLLLFPDSEILRIIGRISFPIFAFMIAEGCRYTKNKLRHFLLIFGLGVLCQLVFLVTDPKGGISYMNILITFSFSVITIYCLQLFKNQIFLQNKSVIRILCSAALFIGTTCGVYFFNKFIELDYGFCGAMLPVFASLFMFEPKSPLPIHKKLDKNIIHVLSLAVGLAVLFVESLNPFKYYALLSLIPLLFYSGRKGKFNTKYFFYIFYPAHLVILYAISYLIYYLA